MATGVKIPAEAHESHRALSSLISRTDKMSWTSVGNGSRSFHQQRQWEHFWHLSDVEPGTKIPPHLPQTKARSVHTHLVTNKEPWICVEKLEAGVFPFQEKAMAVPGAGCCGIMRFGQLHRVQPGGCPREPTSFYWLKLWLVILNPLFVFPLWK